MSYEIKQSHGHVVVLLDGRFAFTADTVSEARREIEEMAAENEAVNLCPKSA